MWGSAGVEPAGINVNLHGKCSGGSTDVRDPFVNQNDVRGVLSIGDGEFAGLNALAEAAG